MIRLRQLPVLRLLALALTLCVGLAASFAVYWVARPDLVLVERVEFVGNSRADGATLRHLSGIANGTTMWGVDLDAARQGVLSHPWVRRAEVIRRWPDTVRVTVEERTPTAVLQYGSLYYLDELGVPFLAVDSDDLDYPILTGLDPILEQQHPDLPRLVIRDVLWMIRELEAREIANSSQVSQVAFDASRGYLVSVAHSRIAFGLEGLPKQMDRLAALRGQGLDLSAPTFVDLAPESVAIVRPLLAAQ